MRKFVGTIVFKTETPIHIGGNRESNVLYLLRLPNGGIVIPSTTWKGAFRKIAEMLAPTFKMKEIEKLAINFQIRQDIPKGYVQMFKDALEYSKSFLDSNENVVAVLKRLGYTEDEIKSEKNLQKLLGTYLQFYCPIGRLFGNQVWASRIRFTDTLLHIPSTNIRAGIGVDRRTGTVNKKDKKALYFIETTDVDIEMKLNIMGELYGDISDKLFASTLEFIEEFGLSIGARKSVGLGNLSVKNANFYVIDLSEDKNGTLLANPFKVKPLSLNEFIAFLRRGCKP